MDMQYRTSIARVLCTAVFCGAALCASIPGASAFDDSKYPDFDGQWRRTATGTPRYDPSKPPGRGQQAPLTEEYRALHEASMADQAAGGQGLDVAYRCIPMGMPRQMHGSYPIEFVVTPKITYVLFELVVYSTRRIYTDGRDWPKDEDPTFAGYSIGNWVDSDGDGRYDVLEVETRNMKGPRTFDTTGIPLHEDNQTVIKERFYLDKADPNLLHVEMTTYDHALTRPWSATKDYRRQAKVFWVDSNCAEGNNHVAVGKEDYLFSGDGYLMPVKKDQPPPDLRYFKTRK
jgi:hypothetical protein